MPEERDCRVQQTAHKNHAKRSAKADPEEHISHPRVYDSDELVHNQKGLRGYKERTYHDILQCPRTTRLRESLASPARRTFCWTLWSYDRFNPQYVGNPKLQGTEDTRCKVPNSGRTGCQMNEYAELSSAHTAFWTGQSQLLDFETLILQSRSNLGDWLHCMLMILLCGKMLSIGYTGHYWTKAALK